MGAFDRNNIGLTFDYVDFEGPCATCKTDCIDEWERMFEKKFGTGFMVEGTNPDPAGGFPNQIIFGKEWPQYSIKPETYGAGGAMLPVAAGYSTIPLSSEVKIGDIRVAYTDHWVITSGQSEDEETRTFMKRPEAYWAEKQIPMPSQGNTQTDADYEDTVNLIKQKRLDWIRCQHTHTDHVHKKTLGGGTTSYNPLSHEYPIAIDDCVTGIWDYNLVDTCTTIERIGIYESVHLYEIFPACGSLGIKSPPYGATDPLIHVINFQPQPVEIHDHSSCDSERHRELYDPGEWFHFMANDSGHAQPCHCPPKVRGQYGKTVMAITSPWCDHTLSQHSKHPHRLGIGHEDGEPQAHLYDNEGQAKVFGAVCETFMYKVGEFYKTTARHFGTSRELFQAPAGATEVLYTFLHPETGGKGGQSDPAQGAGDGGFWCTSDGFGPQGNAWQKKHGAKMLLQLPCNYPETCSVFFPDGAIDGDGVQCCEDWDVAYCDEQMENIFLDEVALLAAFDRDIRHKGADLTINKSRPRIHKQEERTAVTCETSQVYGWVWLMKPCEDFGQDKWERMGSFPNAPTANCVPAGNRCDCPMYPGPPPNTLFNANVGLMNEVQTSWDGESGQAKIISTLWGLDGIDLGNSCSWSQNTGLGFSHCGVEDAFLIRVDFFEGKLEDGNKIDFERIKKADLHPPETIPKKVTDGVDTPWSEGGMHTDLRTSIAAWTNYDSTLPEQSNGSFSQKGNRFQTDFEAAEVFWKAAGSLYWYDIVAEKGEQLNFMGELDDTPGEPTYLATHKMEDNPIGMDKRLQDKDGESPCNTPSRVEAPTTANEFSDSECGINPAIEGCGVVRTTIFTGVGDPAPRFDQGQRINNANNAVDCGGESDEDDEDENSSSECTQAVDEVFNLSEKLYSCVEGGVSIDNCNNLYFVHKPYIKLKAEFNDGCLGDGEFPEYGFFACGIPVGSVDRSIIGTKGEGDNEHCFCRAADGSVIQGVTDFPVVPGGPMRSQQEVCIAPKDEGGFDGQWDCKDFGAPEVSICDTTWSDLAEEYAEGNTYCGLAPEDQGDDDFYFSVSCTSCDNYECGSANDLFTTIIGGGQVYNCKDGVHCCHWLVHNPEYNPDFNPEFDGIDFVPHPQIPNSMCLSTDTFCLVSSYLGGQPHAPYEKGYIWHTVLGWHPDAALDRGVFDYRYSCDAGKSIKIGNEGNHVFDCCDNKQDGEFVECNILFTPKSYERPADFIIPIPPVPAVSLL